MIARPGLFPPLPPLLLACIESIGVLLPSGVMHGNVAVRQTHLVYLTISSNYLHSLIHRFFVSSQCLSLTPCVTLPMPPASLSPVCLLATFPLRTFSGDLGVAVCRRACSWFRPVSAAFASEGWLASGPLLSTTSKRYTFSPPTLGTKRLRRCSFPSLRKSLKAVCHDSQVFLVRDTEAALYGHFWQYGIGGTKQRGEVGCAKYG